ncbi:MAG: hypothetical protein AMXMBFR84_08540 [Candidatus Hydrogenedentota bacterium]
MRLRFCFTFGAFLFSITSAAAERGLILNEDSSHFYMTRTAKDMTVEGLNQFVDQYAGTTVTHLFLNPNAMKASFKSTTREAIWELGNQKMPEGVGKTWIDNARLLHERGLDPYAVWIARCREKGISPWISMRMNDIHDVPDNTSYLHSSFWLNHPEFWRVPNETQGGWTSRALDFGHAEVREHAMAFLRELFERYDPDGFELDWMRFGWHFKDGEEAQGAELLTQFMSETRDLATEWSAKRGHPIKIGARVPFHPDAAKGLGMDGVRWAKEGLVDMLVPTPFWTTSDFDIPVELWRDWLGDTAGKVTIAPGLEFNIRAYPGGEAVANDLASTRGFAAAAWHRGADQIYLFNFMDSGTIPVSQSDYRVLLEKGLARDYVATMPRRHVQAFHDTVPPGFDNGVVLPADATVGAAFRLYTGPKPDTGMVFLVGLTQVPEDAVFTATLNGATCVPLVSERGPEHYPGATQVRTFECPSEAVHEGYNAFRLQQTVGSGAQVVWVEVEVNSVTGFVPPQE